MLRLAWKGTPANLGATQRSVGVGAALAYEFVMTAFLMFVVMAVATDMRAIGATAAIPDRWNRGTLMCSSAEA